MLLDLFCARDRGDRAELDAVYRYFQGFKRPQSLSVVSRDIRYHCTCSVALPDYFTQLSSDHNALPQDCPSSTYQRGLFRLVCNAPIFVRQPQVTLAFPGLNSLQLGLSGLNRLKARSVAPVFCNPLWVRRKSKSRLRHVEGGLIR